MASGMRWTEQMLTDFRQRTERRQPPDPAVPPPAVEVERRNKYASKTVLQDDIKFDSTKEANRWRELELLQKAGAITDLKRQVPFVLAPSVLLAGEARAKPAIRYFADATYMERGQLVVEDTKSDGTRKLAVYRIKKHLMATVHGIHIREV